MTDNLFAVKQRRFTGRDTSKKWLFWHSCYDRKLEEFVSGPYQDRKEIVSQLCEEAGVEVFSLPCAPALGGISYGQPQISRLDLFSGYWGHENRTITEIMPLIFMIFLMSRQGIEP